LNGRTIARDRASSTNSEGFEMGRVYQLRCQTCHEKIDWSDREGEDFSQHMDRITEESENLDETFFFDEAFNNCEEFDSEKDKPLDVQKLKAWLDKHEGHTIIFGW